MISRNLAVKFCLSALVNNQKSIGLLKKKKNNQKHCLVGSMASQNVYLDTDLMELLAGNQRDQPSGQILFVSPGNSQRPTIAGLLKKHKEDPPPPPPPTHTHTLTRTLKFPKIHRFDGVAGEIKRSNSDCPIP